MEKWELEFYYSPLTKGELSIYGSKNEFYLQDDEKNKFFISDDIIDFRNQYYSQSVNEVQQFYDNRSEAYDKYLPLTFLTHDENEYKSRSYFIDHLNLKKNSNVLEIASGSGRDSEIIADRLCNEGSLFLYDISPKMTKRAKNKLKEKDCKISYSLGDASILPFKNNVFDAVYSFGGLGEFDDIKKSLKEMVRVCKSGGKIVVGDESMPVWLRDTYFAKVLTETNKQFLEGLPLKNIPIEARKVRVQWVIGGVFYLIDFVVGEGEPKANYDFNIPGERGGTLRTRYEGKLEGVSPSTKEMVLSKARKEGLSVHEWLEKVINNYVKNKS